jgi:hypothetical protein
MTKDEQLKQLAKLEKTIVLGLHAYDERNQLIVDLVASGVKQAEISRLLNDVRIKLKAPVLTPDAVAATIKRVQKKSADDK